MDLARQEQYQYQPTNTQINHDQDAAVAGHGLLRFRSAPSSLFSTSLESRIMYSRFIDDDDDHLSFPDFEEKPSLHHLQPITSSSPSSAAFLTHVAPPPQQNQHRSQLPPQYPRNPIRSSGFNNGSNYSN